MRPFTPRPYQEIMYRHALTIPRCGLWCGMGMGKTATVLGALDAISLLDVRPALVIAPLRVAQSTWPDEAKKWSDFSHMEVQPVIGSMFDRMRALKNQNAGVFTINYENLPWLVDHFGGRWPFSTIVADESTKLKGFRTRQGGARARALGQVAHAAADRFIELTGTPSPNGLVDLWGQAWFLDKGKRLGNTFTAFADRWFAPDRSGYGLRPLPHAADQIQKALSDICMSMEAKDWFDIREPIKNVIEVELPSKAREAYDDMEKRMYLEIAGEEIEAFNAASKTMKCLQLANGAIYTDDQGAYQEVHDLKLQALESIIEEASGAPVLVAYHFKSDLERLIKAFPKAKVLDTDPRTISDWNQGKIRILLAHPASAGHGLNLQDGGNILVFFSLNWNLEEHQQIIERIGPTRQAQAGHDRPVFIHYITAHRTVDALVLNRLETKREVQDILMEAMKQKGL